MEKLQQPDGRGGRAGDHNDVALHDAADWLRISRSSTAWRMCRPTGARQRSRPHRRIDGGGSARGASGASQRSRAARCWMPSCNRSQNLGTPTKTAGSTWRTAVITSRVFNKYVCALGDGGQVHHPLEQMHRQPAEMRRGANLRNA